MINSKLTAAVALTSTLLVLGCSSGGSGGGGGSVGDYNGNWTQPCSGDDGFGESFQSTNNFNGNTLTSTNYEYTDANCTIPAIPAVVVLTATLAYPGGTTTTTLGEARHINITPTNFTVDGAALTAEELAQATAFGAFDTTYDLILSVDGRLYAGEDTFELDGTTAERRPVELDETDFFVRQ